MTSSAGPFSFGQVVLVPFPFTDLTTSKRRPAVVVSSRAYALNRPDVVVMAVTSQLRPNPAYAEFQLADWRAAGLPKPSAVKPILATLEQRLVIRALGDLSAVDVAALCAALAQIVG